MSNELAVMIGIDGGATNSFGVAVDTGGRVLAKAQSGSLNFFGSSLADSRRALNELVKSLELQLPLGSQFASIVIGSAALFAEATVDQKRGLCQGILPIERTRLVSDCMTAYSGVCLGRPGVLIISGTGSIVLAKSEAGQFFQIGGWGHILGDAGSAYWIAVEAIKAAIAAMETLGPDTSLVSGICRWFEVKELSEIVPSIYRPNYSKEKLAALARYLAEQTGDEDPVFQNICRRAGKELAAQTLAAVRGAGLKLNPLPVYLNGGVLKYNAVARESLIAALQEQMPIKIEPPQSLPLLGAAALALSEAGIPLNDSLVKALQTSYQEFQSGKTGSSTKEM